MSWAHRRPPVSCVLRLDRRNLRPAAEQKNKTRCLNIGLSAGHMPDLIQHITRDPVANQPVRRLRTARSLSPTGFTVAYSPFLRMCLFPLRHGLRLVAIHLVRHAGTVFHHDIRRYLGFGVVSQTLGDPPQLIGICIGITASQKTSEENKQNGRFFHNPSFFLLVDR